MADKVEVENKDEQQHLLQSSKPETNNTVTNDPEANTAGEDTTLKVTSEEEKYRLKPHEAVSLHWNDITLEIKVSGKKNRLDCCSKDKQTNEYQPSKDEDESTDRELDEADEKEAEPQNIQILKGVSGCAKSGELYAIMGASGGGKTTLLSILTGRIRSISSLASNSIAGGNIRLNNITVDCNNDDELNYLLKHIKFVMQHDVLYSTEKCGEVIAVSQKLRSKKAISNVDQKDQDDILQFVMNELDIKKCENTFIGGESVRGLSGGERTRTSIAVEVITNPKILVLDEPTSGLDSASAFKTMRLLKQLTKLGRTVIVCIHQPSTAILNQIDRVMILAKGKVAYEGMVANELESYLKQINCECPPHTNIADHFIEYLNADPQRFINEWIKHQAAAKSLTPALQQQVSSATAINEIQAPLMAPYCVQFSVAMKRFFQIFIRNKGATVTRVVQMTVQALVLGLIWMRLTPIEDVTPSDDQPHDMSVDVNVLTNMNDRFGGLFMAVVFTSLNQVAAAVIEFPAERLIFEKERSCRWYYTSVYILSKTLLSLPFATILIIIFSLITKWLVGFGMTFGEYFIGLLLIDYACDAYSYFLGSFAATPALASSLMPIITNVLILFSGTFIAIESIPDWLAWIRFINPYFYGLEFLSISEFEGATNNGEPVGDLYLQTKGFDPAHKWIDIIVILCIFVFVRICAIVSLMIKYGW